MDWNHIERKWDEMTRRIQPQQSKPSNETDWQTRAGQDLMVANTVQADVAPAAGLIDAKP